MEQKNREKLKGWETKARGVYEEGLKIAREGMHGIEVVAGRTYEVGKLRLGIQRRHFKLKHLFQELGRCVFEARSHRKKGQQLKITPDMAALLDQIKGLEEEIEAGQNNLEHLTTVAKRSNAKVH